MNRLGRVGFGGNPAVKCLVNDAALLASGIRTGSFVVRAEGLGCDSIALAHQDLDPRFRLFELLAALGAQLHAFLKQFERAFERQFTALHLFYDALELLEAGLETGLRARFLWHFLILSTGDCGRLDTERRAVTLSESHT